MIRKFYWLVAIVLTGCAAGSQFLYVEPNPATPDPGQGYVDFFVTTPKVECALQVYHLTRQRALLGGESELRVRVDSHAYIAELAQPTSRLVRVATPPGTQRFSVEARPLVFTTQSTPCPGADVTVNVREGTITPVHLGLDGRLGPNAVLDPIPYRRKESMPYNAAPGPDIELQLIQLAAQVDPNSKHADGTTALMRAATAGRADYVKVLLAAHADPNIASSKGATALASAVEQNSGDLVRSLLKAGAKADAPSSNGASLLTVALQNRQPDIALALLDAGAPINAAEVGKAAPLSIAAKEGYIPVIQALLTRNPELASNSLPWRQAFIDAIDAGKADVVRVLLDANRAPDSRMPGAPVAHAARQGDAAIISLLLARQFDIAQESDGLTPLMVAASRGNAQAARLLIDAGAPVNARGIDGSTALMWAAQGGNADIVRNLIAHRADANFRAVNGTTALAVAQEKSDASIASILKAVTSPQALAAMPANALPPPPAATGTAGSTSPVVFNSKEGDTVSIRTTLVGSDGKAYVTDVVLKSPMMISGMGSVSNVSVHGPILSGTLNAMDAGGHVLPLTAGMTMEQFQKEARARNVTLVREGFRGFRLGDVVVYFNGDKVGDISVGE